MSDMFFTADEHYGHRKIIEYCKRPFANVDEMREELIARHNTRVTKADRTYHIGDMFWRTLSIQETTDILKRLNGQHYLIWGNHDEAAKKIVDQCLGTPKFVWAKDTEFVYAANDRPGVWLSHYAHRVWPKSHQGSYHVFGHTHGVLPDYRRSHDAGVDANNYAPVSYDELDTMMKNRVVPPDDIEKDMKANMWDKSNGTES